MTLQNAPLVMVWRQVSDLAHAEAVASQTLAWPEIGRNEYAVMYDAGNLIVAYWAYPKFQEAALTVGAGCSASTAFSNSPAPHNPASEFLVLAQDFGHAANLIGATLKRRNVSVSGQGDTMSLVDRDGNYAAYLSPTHSVAMAKDAGSLFRSIATGQGGSKVNPYVAHKYMVSDLARSIEFYNSVLGLELVQRTENQAILNGGSALIVLELEPANGLVKSLEKTGRLASDSLVFYVDDVDGAAKQMSAAGVTFPRGVEDAPHGRGAHFFDPDGHQLGIWTRPAQPGPINYFPALQGILEAAASRSVTAV